MIDYGTLVVWEESDLLVLYDTLLPQPLPTSREAMLVIMKHFRGCINPSTVDSALRKYYNVHQAYYEPLKKTTT